MYGSPRRSEIPKPIFPMRLKREITFEELQQDISSYINEKLSNFSEFVRTQSKDAERAKKFEILDSETQINRYSSLPSIEEISRMEERDREISQQLQKIKALKFALETEQNSIRQQLYT